MALPTTIKTKRLSDLIPKIRSLGVSASNVPIEAYGTLLEKMAAELGISLTSALKENAIKKDNVTQGASSGLVNSIRYNVIPVGETGVKFELLIDDYYEYVDRGISGKKKTRNGLVRSNRRPPVAPFENYIITKQGLLSKLVARNPELYNGLSKKAQVKSLAYLMARNIFNYGFEGSQFYSEVVNQQNLDVFADLFTEITGKVIVFSIKKYKI